MTPSTTVFPTTVDAAAARAARGTVVPRLTALIRSIHDPGAPAVGTWSAAEVAVHLAHVWERLPALARGDLGSPLRAPDDLAELTITMVREEPERDLEAIAARIETAASAYLGSPIADGGPRPWLVAGTALPATAFTCHILNESLVHGHDIARAQRRPWPIDPAHAGMAIMGFLFPALSVVDPRFPVDQRRAAGVRACFDIRVRRAGRAYLVLDDGAVSIEPPSGRPVDCHISAEPATLFLMIWSRTGLWRGALAGGMSMWGRRPWLGIRLAGMLRNP
jgi:hypothetical protein